MNLGTSYGEYMYLHTLQYIILYMEILYNLPTLVKQYFMTVNFNTHYYVNHVGYFSCLSPAETEISTMLKKLNIYFIMNDKEQVFLIKAEHDQLLISAIAPYLQYFAWKWQLME